MTTLYYSTLSDFCKWLRYNFVQGAPLQGGFFYSVVYTELLWRDSVILAEELAEVTAVGKSAGETYLRYLHIGADKKLRGDLQAILVKVGYRLLAYDIAEAAKALALADVCGACDVVNGEVGAVILMDIGEHFFQPLLPHS